MTLSHIANVFSDLSESIGLPPIVLICTIALFFFVFIFGLLILSKVRSIRKNLIIINKSFDTLNRRIQEEMANLKGEHLDRDKDNLNSKFEPYKQAEKEFIKESSNNFPFSEFDNQNLVQDENGSDFRKEELLDNYESRPDIKSEILSLLKLTNGPMSYSEIAKNLSKDYADYDFDSILKELDQLENEGKIMGQVSAGKIYFQIKK